MKIGLGPPRWSARLTNLESEIRVDAIMGHLNYFYLTQMGDFKPNTNLSYELYQEGELIKSGIFESAGSTGFGPFYESIPVSPGAYTLKVPYSHYYIGNQQGNALMTATFDTQGTDKNPPYLMSLNILADGEVTDTIAASGSNEIKFVVEDDTELSHVLLFYSTDGTTWNELSLTKAGNGYTAEIPSVTSDSFVSLKLVAQDSAGNSLTYELSPAFYFYIISSDHILSLGEDISAADSFGRVGEYERGFTENVSATDSLAKYFSKLVADPLSIAAIFTMGIGLGLVQAVALTGILATVLSPGSSVGILIDAMPLWIWIAIAGGVAIVLLPVGWVVLRQIIRR